jgi:hypothetical protein
MKKLSNVSKSLIPVILVAASHSQASDVILATAQPVQLALPAHMIDRIKANPVFIETAPNEFQVDLATARASIAPESDKELSDFVFTLSKSLGNTAIVTLKSADEMVLGSQDSGGYE